MYLVCVRALGGVCAGCLQDDTFQESYISTIGVDFVRGIPCPPSEPLAPLLPRVHCNLLRCCDDAACACGCEMLWLGSLFFLNGVVQRYRTVVVDGKTVKLQIVSRGRAVVDNAGMPNLNSLGWPGVAWAGKGWFRRESCVLLPCVVTAAPACSSFPTPNPPPFSSGTRRVRSDFEPSRAPITVARMASSWCTT